MRWTERQRAMLREMGLRPWFRDAPDDSAEPDSGEVAVEARPLERIVAEAASVYSATPHSTLARTAVAATPPHGGRADAPASAGAAAATGQADWLVLGGPFEGADDATRAVVEAEQEKLLANMLRAVGVAVDSALPAGRACHVRIGAPGNHDELEPIFERLRPRCVLALGRAVALALLGLDQPLGSLRGRVHAWRGVPVVVTFPLAYLLRNPGEKAKAWADLCLAAGTVDGPVE